VAIKIQEKTGTSLEMLRKILEEVRSLRKDFLFFLPSENLEGYAHPHRIARSYQKAIKHHPPLTSWR